MRPVLFALAFLFVMFLDPIPKADEPLAWMFDPEKSEISFYTLDGKLYRQFKMPDGDHFIGIYGYGKKVVYYGKDGKMLGKNEKKASF